MTVHGNIGEEFALYDVPVINCSLNGRFSNYKFNINPRNKNEYKKILLNLNNLNFKIDKKEIYKSHAAHRVFFNQDYLLKYSSMIKNIGWNNRDSYKILKYWLKNFKKSNHEIIVKKFCKFIDQTEKNKKFIRMV